MIMKKNISIRFFGVLIIAACLCGACRYPEGPGISFINPEYRIIGNWNLEKVWLNGEEISTTDEVANRPTNYYIFSSDYMLTINTYYNNAIRYSNYGSWQFKNNYKDVAIEFSLLNKKTYYVASIKKLTKKEMIYEYDDEKGNHWRLYLVCLSRVN